MHQIEQSLKKLNEKLYKREVQLKNELPLDVLPEIVQMIIHSLVNYYGFPLDYIASAMLHAASTAIGNSRNLHHQWREAAVLMMVIIGNPGANKSNAIKWAYEPLLKKERLSYKQSAKAAVDGKNYIPEKIITTDSTLEALLELHDHNKRGLCLWVDELIRLISSTTKVNYLLSLFSRMPISNDRKTQRRAIRIEEPHIGVIGSIQSSTIAELLQKGNLFQNGMLERLLIVTTKEEQRSPWRKEKPSSEPISQWERIINILLHLREERDEEGALKENCILQFSEEATEAILAYRNGESQCVFELDDVSQARILAKMDVYLLRLCIVLHCLHNACESKEALIIELETAHKAIRLTEYYKQQAFSLWEKLSQKNPLDHLTELKLQIYNRLRSTFSTQEGLGVARECGMAERTFKYWIKNDTRIFKRLGHGKFEKRYKLK